MEMLFRVVQISIFIYPCLEVCKRCIGLHNGALCCGYQCHYCMLELEFHNNFHALGLVCNVACKHFVSLLLSMTWSTKGLHLVAILLH